MKTIGMRLIIIIGLGAIAIFYFYDKQDEPETQFLEDLMEPHLKDLMIKCYGHKGVIIKEVTLVQNEGDLYGGLGDCEYKGETVGFTIRLTVLSSPDVNRDGTVDGGESSGYEVLSFKWIAEPSTTDDELIEIFKNP